MSNRRKLRDPDQRRLNLQQLQRELRERGKQGITRKQRRFEARAALRRAERMEAEPTTDEEQANGQDD